MESEKSRAIMVAYLSKLMGIESIGARESFKREMSLLSDSALRDLYEDLKEEQRLSH